MEDIIRRDLHFDDAKSTACLPNATIFEELVRMGAKTTAWNEFSSTMECAIICLANNHKFNFSKYILDNMVKNLEGGVKFFMFPRFLQASLDKPVEGMNKHKEIYVISSHTKKIFANMKRQGHGFSGDNKQKPKRKQKKATKFPLPGSEIPFKEHVALPSNDPLPNVLDLEIAKNAQAKDITKLKKRVKKLVKRRRPRPTGLGRLKKVGLSSRVESSRMLNLVWVLRMMYPNRGRSIKEIDQNAEITLVDEAQDRIHDTDMFGVDDLEGNEVILDVTEKTTKKEVSIANPVTTAGEVVTTANVEVSVAHTTTTIADVDDEITLAKTLIAIKAAKPKVITTAATIVTTAITTLR
ncbi:hypothetical protein Tco_0959345, partial [Tanacetum coccineum]